MRYWLGSVMVASMLAGVCAGVSAGAPTTTAFELRGGRPTGPRAGLPADVDDRKDRDDASAPHAVIVAAWDGSLLGNDLKAAAAGIAGVLLVVGSLLARRGPPALNQRR